MLFLFLFCGARVARCQNFRRPLPCEANPLTVTFSVKKKREREKSGIKIGASKVSMALSEIPKCA